MYESEFGETTYAKMIDVETLELEIRSIAFVYTNEITILHDQIVAESKGIPRSFMKTFGWPIPPPPPYNR
jgi:hypothetical protein